MTQFEQIMQGLGNIRADVAGIAARVTALENAKVVIEDTPVTLVSDAPAGEAKPKTERQVAQELARPYVDALIRAWANHFPKDAKGRAKVLPTGVNAVWFTFEDIKFVAIRTLDGAAGPRPYGSPKGFKLVKMSRLDGRPAQVTTYRVDGNVTPENLTKFVKAIK